VLCYTRDQTLTNVPPHHALHSVSHDMASGTHLAVDQSYVIARCPEVPPPTATEPIERDPPRAEFGSSRLEPFLPSRQSQVRGAEQVFKRFPAVEMTRIARPPPPPPCATASLSCSKSSATCLALALAPQPPKPEEAGGVIVGNTICILLRCGNPTTK